MATGGQEEISNQEIAVVSGSEAVFDNICQPCSEETTKEGVGFCVVCAEWLCEECFRTHRRPKPTRHHALKNLEEMKSSLPSVERVDRCIEKCGSHNGKTLKYFCPVHDIFGCNRCIIESHGNCKAQYIPDVSKSIDTINEFQQTAAELDAVTIAAREIVTGLNNKVELVKENRAETENAFQKYGQKLQESLDNAIFALKEQCEKKEEEEEARLKVISERCETEEKEGLSMKSQLEAFEQSGQHCNKFMALKRSKSKLKTMESSITTAKRSSRVNMYTFRPNLDIETVLNGSGGIGTLVEKGFREAKDYTNMQARHIADISVNMDNNTTCHISGAVVLPKDKLVIVDHQNSQVKVVDMNQNKTVSMLQIDGDPWSICKINHNTVAVPIYDRKLISFMAIGQLGEISKSKDIAVNSECEGIAVVDDRIIVTYEEANKMEIMDMDGTVLHTIKTNTHGNNMFHGPQFVIPSPDKKSVYVSNHDSDTVICMKLEGTGTVLHEYKDVALKCPTQVAVDNNGMCFVGGYDSNNVHLITPDCKKIKVVLCESDGLNDVNAVCYCKDNDRLYIGMHSCDIIKVFQLS